MVRLSAICPDPGRSREIDAGSCIEDLVLAVPIPIEPLIRAVKADDAMSRALLIKENPVLMDALERREQKGLERGRQEGMAKGLLAMLAARGFSLEPADRARILGESDPQRFERWFARAVCCTSIADMFVEP